MIRNFVSMVARTHIRPLFGLTGVQFHFSRISEKMSQKLCNLKMGYHYKQVAALKKMSPDQESCFSYIKHKDKIVDVIFETKYKITGNFDGLQF